MRMGAAEDINIYLCFFAFLSNGLFVGAADHFYIKDEIFPDAPGLQIRILRSLASDGRFGSVAGI